MKKTAKKSFQLMDKQQYRLWQALYLAFYSPSLYVDVARHWRGLSLRYFLLLLLCVSFPLSVRFGLVIHQYFNAQIVEPLSALPPLYIYHGEVSFDHFMPYTITNRAGDATAIIDTTGLIKNIDRKNYPKLTWLITENTIYFSLPPINLLTGLTVPVNQYDKAETLDPDVNEVFVGKALIESTSVNPLFWMIAFMFYPCIVTFFFVTMTVMLFAFAWAAQFFARVLFKVKITYQASFRLLMVSLTPLLTLYFGLLAMDIIFKEAGFIYLGLFATYFSLSVVALKRANSALVIA